jgi:uncharacterized membrane protein
MTSASSDGSDTEPTKRQDRQREGEAPTDAVEQSIETILRLENTELRRRSWTDVLADAIAGFTGSISFVILHLLWFSSWAAWNTGILTSAKPFDPYPFQLLAMIVSLEGVLLVTFVLIKQNRMTHLSDRRAHLDLQINLLAEREATHVLRLLRRVAHRLQVLEDLPEEKLTEDTRVEGLIETLDQKLQQEERSGGSAAGRS